MDDFVLSDKELVFLASKLGAQNFFGLRDPFFGMDIPEIRQEMFDLQRTLEQKGYASLGFDDAFRLKPEVSELISTCAFCDKYVAADMLLGPGRQKNYLYYFRGMQSVELEISGSVLTLKKTTGGGTDKLIESMEWRAETLYKPDVQAAVSFSVLSKAQALGLEDSAAAQAVLEDDGCDPGIAEILLAGLARKASYHSITSTDLQKRKIANMICINSENGSLRLTPTDSEDAESWLLQYTGIHEMTAALSDMFGPFGGLN